MSHSSHCVVFRCDHLEPQCHYSDDVQNCVVLVLMLISLFMFGLIYGECIHASGVLPWAGVQGHLKGV